MNRIEDRRGPGELPFLNLHYGSATATVCLQGGQITSWQPGDAGEVFWLSDSARFGAGQPIRGGVPLCWPWFGDHPERADWPRHGFARTGNFQVAQRQSSAQDTRVTLAWDGATALEAWRGCLRLELEIRLADTLWVELRTTNIGSDSREVGCALHSYFRVGEVGQVRIPELRNRAYRDKTAGFALREGAGDLQIVSETDRVYLDAPPRVHLEDPQLRRRLAISCWGNTDLVVWNPWQQLALTMADFDDEGYTSMLCIEPALALNNRVPLAPGETLALGNQITVHRN